MAAAFDSTRWVREVGVDVRGNRDWTFMLSLHDKPSQPPDTVTSKMTRFTLNAWAEFWSLQVYHRGTEFRCERNGRRPIVGLPPYGWPQLVLPLPKLESVRPWLTRVERKLGVTFHRDRPRVRSNVKGAAKLIAAWIAET